MIRFFGLFLLLLLIGCEDVTHVKADGWVRGWSNDTGVEVVGSHCRVGSSSALCDVQTREHGLVKLVCKERGCERVLP